MSCAIQTLLTRMIPLSRSTERSTAAAEYEYVGVGPTPAPFHFAHRARRTVRADRAQRAVLRLGEHHRLRKGQALVRVRRVEDAPVARAQAIDGHVQLARGRVQDRPPHLARGLDGGVTGHQGDAAGVAAEIDGSQVGVGGDDADIEGIDAQHFGNDIGQNRIGTLTDLGGAAEDRRRVRCDPASTARRNAAGCSNRWPCRPRS